MSLFDVKDNMIPDFIYNSRNFMSLFDDEAQMQGA